MDETPLDIAVTFNNSPESCNLLIKLGDYLEEAGIFILGSYGLPLPSKIDHERYEDWLDKGWHASMSYLERYREVREDPALLLDDAKTMIAFMAPYGHKDSAAKLPRVAKYAERADYHRWLRRAIEKAFDRAASSLDLQLRNWYRVTVDSAPVLERGLARSTGAGFVGKNTCFIHPRIGSFVFLAEAVTTVILPEKKRQEVGVERSPDGGCGSCRRCQVHCPTGALDEAYKLDANKCLSYWTIEHRGSIPEKYWQYLAKYWYGCDICQDVCPYNRGKSPNILIDRKIPQDLDLYEVAVMDQAYYERVFGGSPMTRAKRSGLRRNALIALTVTRDVRLEAAMDLIGENDEAVLQQTKVQIRSYIESIRQNQN